MDLIALIQSIPGAGPYIPYILLAMVLCAIIATCLPGPTADSSTFYKFIYALVNKIALNFGRAANLAAPSSTGVVGGPGAVTNPQMATGSVPATSARGVQLQADADVVAKGETP
jgi:hypothetical protein